MKITVDISDAQSDAVATVVDNKGEDKAFARICLKTLHVLKSRHFSGSELMRIESLVKPLKAAVATLQKRA